MAGNQNIRFNIQAIDNFSRIMDRLDSQLGDAEGNLGRLEAASGAVGRALGAMGLAVGGAVAFAVDKAAKFEHAMSSVKAVSGASGDEMAKLTDLAKEMGRTTSFSASEAAKGIEELMKAGVKTEDIMGGGLKSALDLAVAGELELAEAAEIASTALNAFKDDNLTVEDAANILAGAANSSATSVHDLRYSLSMVSAVSAGLGMSFEGTNAALAVLANNGLKGSDAGTSLKTMMSRLVPMTDKAYGKMKDLGLVTLDNKKAFQILSDEGFKPATQSTEDVMNAVGRYVTKTKGIEPTQKSFAKHVNKTAQELGLMNSAFFDSEGNIESMAVVSEELKNAMKGLSAEQRQQALYTMFGSDAIRASLILSKEGAKGIEEMTAAMSKVTAAEVAAERLNNFKGALTILKSAIEGVAISLGTFLLPALTNITQFLTTLVSKFAALPESMQAFIAIGAVIAAIVMLIAGAFILLMPGIMATVSAFQLLAAPIQAAIAAALPIVGVIAAIVAALVLIGIGLFQAYQHVGWFRDMVNAAWAQIKEYFNSALTFIQGVVTSVLSAVSSFVGSQLAEITAFWAEHGDTIQTGIQTVMEVIGSVIQAAMSFIQGVFEVAWPIISGAVEIAWGVIKAVIETSLDIIMGIIETVMAIIEGDWEGAWNSILGIAEDIMNNIIGFFEDIDLSGIGADIIDGLISGIMSMGGAVSRAVSSLAALVPDGLKDFLNIHSPSRLIRDQVGKFIPQGLAVGIDGNINAVKKSVRAMASAAVPDIPSMNKIAQPIPSMSSGYSGSQSVRNASARPSVTNNSPVNVTLNYNGSGSADDAQAMIDMVSRGLEKQFGNQARVSGVKGV